MNYKNKNKKTKVKQIIHPLIVIDANEVWN